MKTWYHKRHLNPDRFFVSKLQLCVSNIQAFHNCSFKLYFLKYIFTKFCSRKPSDVGYPVLPKIQKCPTLTAAAYVGFGPSRDRKGGFIYPDFYENFIGFIQLKAIILRSTQYKVMVILVQGQFKAVSMQIQPIGYFILFTAWSTVSVNSVEYTIS